MEITHEIVRSLTGVFLWPHPVLRRRCVEIDSLGEVSDLVVRMLEIMRDHRGVGLAAPQVGIPARLFVWEVDGVSGAVVNPVLIEPEGMCVAREGCLSLPGVAATVERRTSITLVGMSAGWEPLRATASGLLARVWQHEFDHLDGLTLAECMSAEGRGANALALKRLKMAARGGRGERRQ